MLLRALLDANVFISYLLSPNGTSSTVRVVEAAFTGAYQLLLPFGVITELRGKTASSDIGTGEDIAANSRPFTGLKQPQVLPYKAKLAGFLESVAEILPEIPEPLPEVGRDRKNDYLFAHAVVGRADVLVSGDKGVQAVGQIGEVRIESPAGFLRMIEGVGD